MEYFIFAIVTIMIAAVVGNDCYLRGKNKGVKEKTARMQEIMEKNDKIIETINENIVKMDKLIDKTQITVSEGEKPDDETPAKEINREQYKSMIDNSIEQEPNV